MFTSCFQLLTISEQTYSEKAESGNVEPIKVSEQVGALYGHMSYTGKYLEDGFNLILSEISTRCNAGGSARRQLLLEGRTDDGEEEDLSLDFDELVVDALTRENEKKLDEIQNKLEELRLQAEKPSNAFEMSVKVTKGEDSSSLVVFTTLDGVPYNAAEIETEAVDPSTKSKYTVEHSLFILDEGQVIVTLNENPQLLFVKATLNVGDNNIVEHTELVELK